MKRLSILLITVILMLFLHSQAFADSVTVDDIIYNKDKSITVYGSCNGEFSEFGICIDADEKNGDFTNSVKYKAYGGKDENGRFGIIIPYSEFAADGVFALKAYSITDNDLVIYSSNTLVADVKSVHSRIPQLSSAIPSEGELYPAFSKEVNEYYVLVDKLPEQPLKIDYKLENSNDSVIYEKPLTIAEDVVIKLSGDFLENTYRFSFRLKKSATLAPESYIIKEEGNIPYSRSTLKLSDTAVNHISFDSSVMPEKYVPTGVYCLVSGTENGSISVAPSTEPDIKLKDLSQLDSSYSLQKGTEIKANTLSGKTDIKLDEKQFKNKSFLKLAVSANADSGITNLSMKVDYFENIPLPITDSNKETANLSSIYVDGANEIYPEFRSDVYEYYAVFDKLPASLPKISCMAYNPSSKVAISDAGSLSGETIITVTSGNDVKTYKIKYREYKEADMKLFGLAAKRTPYELFTIGFPKTDDTPYSSYLGRMENEYGTSHSHLSALAFDTSVVSNNNIHISTAELTIFAMTNCREGMYIDIYRSGNTNWPVNKNDRLFYATANHFVPRGAEGVLNEPTLIKYGNGSKKVASYRYYTIPLKTEGFTDAKSVNLYYMARWQSVNPPNATYQTACVWLGINGNETLNGVGMLPTVHIKYFDK